MYTDLARTHKGYQAWMQTLSSWLSQYYTFFLWHSQQYSTICIMALQMGREIADFLMLSAGCSSSESLKNQPDYFLQHDQFNFPVNQVYMQILLTIIGSVLVTQSLNACDKRCARHLVSSYIRLIVQVSLSLLL